MSERSNHGWFTCRDGTKERCKPCPKGTFRINNSDTLYELCGSKQRGRTVEIYFREHKGTK